MRAPSLTATGSGAEEEAKAVFDRAGTAKVQPIFRNSQGVSKESYAEAGKTAEGRKTDLST